MNPEEILYNAYIEYTGENITLEEFNAKIANDPEFTVGTINSLYNNSTPEVNSVIDKMLIGQSTAGGQSGIASQEKQPVEVKEEVVSTKRDKVNRLIPVSLFEVDEDVLSTKEQASGLSTYLSEVLGVTAGAGRTGTFGQTDEDKIFINGLSSEEIVLDLSQDPSIVQAQLADILLNLDENGNYTLEELAKSVESNEKDFANLSSYDIQNSNSMFSGIPDDIIKYADDMAYAPDLFSGSTYSLEQIERDNGNAFEPYVPSSESSATKFTGQAFRTKEVSKELGYESEFNEARNQLSRSGVRFIDENGEELPIVEEQVRKIIKRNYLKAAAAKQYEKYIEQGDDKGNKDLTETERNEIKFKSKVSLDKTDSDIEKKSELLEVYVNELDNFGIDKDGSLKKDINGNESGGFYYNNLFNEFKKDKSIQYEIKPGEKYYQTEDGRKIPVWLYDGFVGEINRFEFLSESIKKETLELNEDISKSKDKAQQLDIVRKNYNDMSKFGVGLGLATIDLISSTAYGVYQLGKYASISGIAGSLMRENLGIEDPVEQAMMALKNWTEDVRDDYKDDISFNNIDSWQDVGQYTYQSIASQAPLIVSMMATGGLTGVAAKSAGITGKALQTISNVSSSAFVGMSSFGGKFSEMEYEEFKSGKKLYSEAEIVLKSLGYGLVEGTLAYFSTAPMLNKGVGKIAGNSDDLLERELAEGFSQEISKHLRKDIIPETLGEMFFEGLTTGGQNLIDGKPFFENMKETIVSSGFWGAGMSGAPSLYVAGTKNFTNNADLNTINTNTRKANELRRANSELVNSIKNDNTVNVEEVKAEINSNISLIETYEANAVDAYLTVENNVREQGMTPDAATDFIEGQTNLYNIRNEAYQVANSNKTDIQKQQELETIGSVYNMASKGMEMFNNTETFGSPYGALMMSAAGKDVNDSNRKKYTEITDQATQNLLTNNINSKNPKQNYNPSGSEIAIEADNIIFEQQMDKQLAKDRKQSEKLGHTFIDFESKEEAAQQVGDAFDVAIELENNADAKANLQNNKRDVLNSIYKGKMNGGSISGAGFELDFVVRENMTKNKRFTSGLHENTHTISRKLLKNNPEAFKNLGDQIIKYLVYTGQESALKAMGASNANLELDGDFDYDEVISSFMELIPEGKVDLDKMDNFKAIMGKLMNDGLMNASDGDYNIEFKGQKDILEFFLGFGKKIAEGDLSITDLAEAQDKFSVVNKKGKVISISETTTQNRIAASQVKASETVNLSSKDKKLFDEVDQIYNSDKSIKDKGLEIGNLYRNFITSRLNKGFRVGKTIIRPRDFEGFSTEILEDVVSDMATGGSGIPGLVKAYENRDMSKFKDIELAQWINAKLNQRILGYLPNDLITNDMSIDSETAKQIEDAKAGKFDVEMDVTSFRRGVVKDTDVATEGRDLKSFEELSIVTPEIFDEVRSIVSKRLKKLAITKGVTATTVTQEINNAIETEITKVIKAEMGPITRSVLGFAPKQYVDFINANRDTIIGAMPIDLIKQKAKSKAWSNIFKLKEVGREDIKKVSDEGKVTNYRKQIFEVQKPDPQEFAKYFTRGGYTTLIERQRSLIKPIAKELAKTELFKLSTDPDFIADLSDRTGMTSNEVTSFYIDNVMSNMQDVLDQTAGEQRSQDIVKFSEALDTDQRSEFSSKADDFVKNFKDLGVNPTPANIFNALKKTIYNSPNNVNFTGEEGLKTLKEFANEISQPLTRYLKKESLLLDVNTADFFFQGIGLNSSRIDLKTIFSIGKSFIQLFKKGSKGQKRQRELSTGFSNYYYEKNLEKGLSPFDAALDTIVTSLKWMKGHQATAGKDGRYKRLQTYDGTQDYVDNNLSTIPGVEKITGETSVNKNGVKTFTPTEVVIDGVTVPLRQPDQGFVNDDGNFISTGKTLSTTSPSQSTSKTKAKFESEYEMRQKEADEAWNLMMEYLQYIKDNGTDLDFAMTMASLKTSGMNSILKAAAPVEYFYVGPDMRPSQLRYEHVIPTDYVALEITKYFNGDKSVDIDQLKSRYKVAVIPIVMDENINVQLQQAMPLDWSTTMSELDRYYNDVNMGMNNMYPVEVLGGKDKGKIIGKDWSKLDDQVQKAKPINQNLVKKSEVVPTDANSNSEFLSLAQQLDQALKVARDPNAKEKKIRVFDFDDTIAQSKSDVLYTMPDGTKGKINAAEFAEQGITLTEQGAKFDFSEFDKVKDGIKGPLFDVAKRIFDKNGSKDLFILTARPMAAAMEIKTFLDGLGIDIPIENIAALENSSPLAKSQWILNKAGEGYNNFYFADDAFKNVEAVQKVLAVTDVKSKVQQAKVKFSESVDQKMNDIIYQKTGIDSFKEYSDVRAKSEGRDKRSFDLIPASAEDFGGLLYNLLGKGKEGDAQWEWMQENLIKPYNRGINDMTVAQNVLAADFKALKNSLEGIPKDLQQKAFGGFTFEDIVRVNAWTQQGIEVEGLSKKDLKEINNFVNENPEIGLFANQLVSISKADGYHYPGKDWIAGTITTDMREGLRTTSRTKHLAQWNENIDQAFSNKNLNKLEAAFGSKYREALEDSIRRMKTGTNRGAAMGRIEARFLDYINNSIGGVMFLNARSAVLQTISSLNFIELTGDNNIFKAGKAFANQKQYWSDFMTLMNSDYLVDRRNGLKINVNESEIAAAAKTSTNKSKAVIATLLKKGFVLTQIADSFAIATGGSSYYRNKVNAYLKQGLSKADAEARAFEDFKAKSEESQQSSDPSKISQQQASTAGKVILAFANTPSQYARIMKKAGLDIVNRRGDWKDNVSKILYYGALQNIIFTTLQSALFAVAFNDDEEEQQSFLEKYKGAKTINSMSDNILRGLGVGGAVVSTLKNIAVDIYDRSQKSRPEYADVAFKLLDISPPIDIKVSKFRQGMTTWEYGRKDPEARDPFNINNPAYEAAAKVISSTTNVPLDRLYQKVENVKGALDDDNENWKRLAMGLGWPKWQLMSEKQRKEDREKRALKRKEANTRRYAYKPILDEESYKKQKIKEDTEKYFKLRKPEQVRKLDSLGLTSSEIKSLKYEKDRVNKLLELMK